MADEEQAANVDMNSSQGTYVAARETRPPPSAQHAMQSSIDRSDNVTQSPGADRSTDALPSGVKAHGQGSSFTDILQQYQERLNHDFDEYERNLQQADPPNEDISAFNWDELECAYQKEVGDVAMKEKEIMSQFDARFKVFEKIRMMDFTNVLSNSCCGCKSRMSARLNERSRGTVRLTLRLSHVDKSRLKTQSAFVQNSEAELAQKEQHCE